MVTPSPMRRVTSRSPSLVTSPAGHGTGSRCRGDGRGGAAGETLPFYAAARSLDQRVEERAAGIRVRADQAEAGVQAGEQHRQH